MTSQGFDKFLVTLQIWGVPFASLATIPEHEKFVDAGIVLSIALIKWKMSHECMKQLTK